MRSSSPTNDPRERGRALRPHAPGDGVIHPLSLLAIALLVANDHWWKHAYPGVLTGKISDFAGLAFFPLLLTGAWEVLLAALKRPWGPSHRAIVIAALATGLVFTAVKAWEPAAPLYKTGLAALQWPFRAAQKGRAVKVREVALVQDKTDLIALPALIVAYWVGRRRVSHQPRP